MEREDLNHEVSFFSSTTLLIPAIATILVEILGGPGTQCNSFLQKPTLYFGLSLLGVSFAGAIGGYYGINCFIGLFVLALRIIILLLFGFSIFAFNVSNVQSHDDDQLGRYSNWLKKRVNDVENWNGLKKCLVDTKSCHFLSFVQLDTHCPVDSQFLAEFLPPTLVCVFGGGGGGVLKLRCCKPPDSCNYENKTLGVWIKNSTINYGLNPDCKARSNDQKELCFNCQSCKAAVLEDLKNSWQVLASITLLLIFVFLIPVFCLGCWTFCHNWHDYCRQRAIHPSSLE